MSLSPSPSPSPPCLFTSSSFFASLSDCSEPRRDRQNLSSSPLNHLNSHPRLSHPRILQASNPPYRNRKPNSLYPAPQYGISPHLFSSPPQKLQFIMPPFSEAGLTQSCSHAPAFSKLPSWSHPSPKSFAPLLSQPLCQPCPQPDKMLYENSSHQHPNSLGHSPRRPSQPSVQLDPSRPICSLYGHSVRGVKPDLSDFPTLPTPEETPSRSMSPFNPIQLGIHLSTNCNHPNLYSSSGFDFMRALAYVVNRPNPQIDIGPVDTSTAFVVVDARKPDLPIIFASASFSSLTGYDNSEIVGSNCRFLQSPRSSGPAIKAARRKHSDQVAAHHMKAHIMAGKESQSSLINYRKNGEAFINLVTVIPIMCGTDDIAYHIGFQVDMALQQKSILSQKAHGTYITHDNFPQVQHQIAPISQQQPHTATITPVSPVTALPPIQPTPRGRPPLRIQAPLDRLSTLSDTNSTRSGFKTLLDENRDLVIVVSLKGTLFFVSAACQKLLGYEEEELINQNISTFCHPGDLTGVLRQLKEIGNTAHTPLDLIYRAVSKNQTRFWMEAQGQLHVEAGKGRKYVVLVGRERVLGPLFWQAIHSRGGLAEREFWTKLSMDGMCLYSTSSVKDILGYSPDSILGRLLHTMAPEADRPNILRAIRAAWHSTTVLTLAHSLIKHDGTVVECISDFHSPRFAPSLPQFAPEDTATISSSTPTEATRTPPVIYCQIIEADSAQLRANTALSLSPHLRQRSSVQDSSPPQPPRTCLAPAGDHFVTGLPNTVASTSAPSRPGDNLFGELDTGRKTAWNFELSELKLRNKALRAELASRLQQGRSSIPKTSHEAAKPQPSGPPTARTTHATDLPTLLHVIRRESPDELISLQSSNPFGCGDRGTFLGISDGTKISKSRNGFSENYGSLEPECQAQTFEQEPPGFHP